MISTENDNPLFVTLQSFLLQSSILSKRRITSSVWKVYGLSEELRKFSQGNDLGNREQRRQRYKNNTTYDQICLFQETSKAL